MDKTFFFFFWILSILTYTHKGKVEKVLVIHCPMFIPPLVYILYLNRESWSFEPLNKKKYQKKQRECQQYLSICILMGLLYEYEFVKRSVCSLIINLWTNFYLFICVTNFFFFFFFFLRRYKKIFCLFLWIFFFFFAWPRKNLLLVGPPLMTVH